MSRYASVARNLEEYEYAQETPSRREKLSVVKGGGLDAKARKGVSMNFVHVLQIVLLGVFVFFALGAARVAITAQTVSILRENSSMQSRIEEMNDENDSLRVERSSLSSSERIVAIATGSYGMHLASASESLALSDDEVIVAEAEAEANGNSLRVVAASME